VSPVRGFKRFRWAETFVRDYRRLAPDHQAAVDDCLRDLQAEFIPAQRRWHRIDRQKRPPVFSVDVYPNKSWKLTCHVEDSPAGQVLVLRRVAPHREIDRGG
jgi:hypothetical protein